MGGQGRVYVSPYYVVLDLLQGAGRVGGSSSLLSNLLVGYYDFHKLRKTGRVEEEEEEEKGLLSWIYRVVLKR